MTEQDMGLTRLAAKAAGIELEPGTTRIAGTMQTWRPLTDDGDAQRLAVKLYLLVQVNAYIPSENAWGHVGVAWRGAGRLRSSSPNDLRKTPTQQPVVPL